MPIPMAPSMALGPASSRSTATVPTSRTQLAWSRLSSLMPHSFPNTGNAAEFVGQTPWSARDALVPRPEQPYQHPAKREQADGGVGRSPGGLPHDQCMRGGAKTKWHWAFQPATPAFASAPVLIRRPARHQRPLPNLQAPPPRRQHFPRVEPALRVEQSLQAPHHLQRVRRELLAHELVLFHAHAVLAGDRSARFHAIPENLFPRGARPFQLARLARVE